MPIEFDYLEEHHLVISRYCGVITDENLLSTFKEIINSPVTKPGFLELALHEDGFAPSVTEEGLSKQIQMLHEFHGDEHTRVACVVGQLSHEVFVQHVKTLASNLPGGEDSISLFNSIYEALKFLGIRADSLPLEDYKQFDFKYRLTYEAMQQRVIKAEQERNEASAMYQALFEQSSPTAVLDVKKGLITKCSDNFCKLLGYERNELLQMSPPDFEVLDTPGLFHQRVAIILSKGDYSFDVTFRTKSGECKPVHVHAWHVRVNDRDLLQCVVFDLSEQKEKEIALAQKNEKLSITLEQLAETLTQKSNVEKAVSEQRYILDAIGNLQRLFIEDKDEQAVFDSMLHTVIRLTESEYGFVDAMHHDSEGKPYLQALAITNIAWDEATQHYYEKNAPQGFKFTDFNTLFGPAAKYGDIVISNFNPDDPRRKGTPSGHPSIDTFLAVPLKYEEEIIGLIGLANRESGFTMELVHKLESVWTSCAQLVYSHKNKKALEERKRQLELTLDGTLCGTWKHNVSENEVIFDQRAKEILGISSRVSSLEDWADVIYPADLEVTLITIRDGLSEQKPRINVSYRTETNKGVRHLKVDSFVIYNKDGIPETVYGLIQDVTDHILLKQGLSLSKQKYQRLIDDLSDDYIVYSQNAETMELLYLSRGFEPIFGIPISEVLNKHSADVINWCPGEMEHALEHAKALRSGEDHSAYINREYSFVHPSGEVRYLSITSHLTENENGIAVFEGIAEHVTAKKLAEKRLRDAATHDELTGLYNRRAILDKLQREFRRAQRYTRHFSILLLDLDFFKKINDHFGHLAGDLVLKEFAKAVTENIRTHDIAGRYGGEEFLVILPESSLEEAQASAERIRKKVESLNILYEGRCIQLTSSIGVSIWDESIPTIESLISKADSALYYAKESGRNMTQVFESEPQS